MYINSSGNLAFRVAGVKSGKIVRQSIAADGSSEMLNDGSWHFLLGTFDVSTGRMSFYIDGRLANADDIDIESLVSSRCFTVAAIGKKKQSLRRRKKKITVLDLKGCMRKLRFGTKLCRWLMLGNCSIAVPILGKMG